VIQWQVFGPNIEPGELAARAERPRNDGTIRSRDPACEPENPRRCEAHIGSSERRASVPVKAQNLPAGSASRIARYLSRKSTSSRSSVAAARIFGSRKRPGSSPYPRSFHRTNCFGRLLPGRPTACRAPAKLRFITRSAEIEQQHSEMRVSRNLPGQIWANFLAFPVIC
jgi:hypothetical protein